MPPYQSPAEDDDGVGNGDDHDKAQMSTTALLWTRCSNWCAFKYSSTVM